MSESLGWWIRSEMLLDDARGLARAGELAARLIRLFFRYALRARELRSNLKMSFHFP
jgi:hypothetical protein